ncbi:GH1 family beta-glucosidase [Nocardioides stalactiti]|uniref:GH1 family beta-glucosidase n=1 Tax=Nocardioides stalactiti TaxID=2755356 RepID=UPI0028A7C597|nr:GH1 family beta-glucosidase [Nocardioides stalactiti]
MSEGAHGPSLPASFRFGVSSTAYQVEGAVAEDGRGPSIWDTFCAEPDRVADGSDGAVAADHYHRVDEDVALLADLGVGGYRFSIAWPRVQPTGSGPVNAAGLDHYDRLVDRLLEVGVQPMATLYAWDLPQPLEDDGGWLNRATVDRFADYAAVVGERLADRVEHWVPVNEPSVVTTFGYATGEHAPGKRLMLDATPVAHHLLLGHGRAAIALRAAGATSIGCANNHAPVWPASDDDADVGASKLFDAFWNGMYLEPMLLGRYPVDLEPLLDGVVRDGDLATIRQPLDFYGVDYYTPIRIGVASEEAPMPFEFLEVVGYPRTDLEWSVVPEALREWLIIFRARLRAALPPIYVTAAGCSYDVEPDAAGVVDDQSRIDFHTAPLAAVSDAIRLGVDVRGYYAWSFLDDFAWTIGERARFGLVHVDRVTQQRTRKRSFQWYADLIAATRNAND